MNYDFRCPSCGWNGSRYANLKNCPRCQKPVDRVTDAVTVAGTIIIRDGVLTLPDGRRFVAEAPGGMFGDIFPDGVKLKIGKYESIHPTTLKKAMASDDVEFVREVLIAMLYHYSVVYDRSNRLSDLILASPSGLST